MSENLKIYKTKKKKLAESKLQKKKLIMKWKMWLLLGRVEQSRQLFFFPYWVWDF